MVALTLFFNESNLNSSFLFKWTGGDFAGFCNESVVNLATYEPWLPVSPDKVVVNVEYEQQAGEGSAVQTNLQLFHQLMELRK